MKNYSKLLETKISSKEIYNGIVKFKLDTVRLVNGETATREYMEHPGASAILVVENNKILLVEQYRYAINQITLEIPAGKLNKGQTPLSCAKAELEEETGYKANKIKKIFSFTPSVAFDNETLHLFFAKGLKSGKMHLDDDEFLNVKWIDFDKALKMAKTGKITDSKTIIAIYYYALFGKELK